MKLTFKPVALTMVCLLFAISVYSQVATQTPEIKAAPVRARTGEEMGDESLEARDYKKAIFHYTLSWIGCRAGFGDGNSKIQANRERLAQKMSKALANMRYPPNEPEKALDHDWAGIAIGLNSNTVEEYYRAIKEWQEAVNLAPWNSDYHIAVARGFMKINRYALARDYAVVAGILAQKEDDKKEINDLLSDINKFLTPN